MTAGNPASSPIPATGIRANPEATRQRTIKRNRSEARFRAFGLGAIFIGLFFLVVLAYSIISSGIPAFTKTVVEIDFTLTKEQFDAAESELFKTKAYAAFFIEALKEKMAHQSADLTFDVESIERLLGKIGSTLREHYRANQGDLGKPVDFSLTAASKVDGYLNGRVTRANMEDSRFLMKSDLDLVDVLRENGIIRNSFNWNFITGTDTGVDNPGGAGIGASVVGSFFMMIVVLFLSLPIGVAASIYLEEFAPKNRFTD